MLKRLTTVLATSVILVLIVIFVFYGINNQNSKIVTIMDHSFEIPKDFEIIYVEENSFRIENSKTKYYVSVKLLVEDPPRVDYGMPSSSNCIKVNSECLNLSESASDDELEYSVIIERDVIKDPSLDVRNNIDTEDTYYGIKYKEVKYTRDYSFGDYFPKDFSIFDFKSSKLSIGLPAGLSESERKEALSELGTIIQNMLNARN